MDVITAIKERWSCRNFLSKPIEEEKLNLILECGLAAPSPANKQPWEFIVIKDEGIKTEIRKLAEKAKEKMTAAGGWDWIARFKIDFIEQAPVLVAVVGDPAKTGAEQFLPGRGEGYEHACAAAVQNMLLAAHALGLGSLWLSLFDKPDLLDLLKIEKDKNLIALVCLGYPAGKPAKTSRKTLAEKVRYL
ncbi:MAG TPA: nitroreductase [Clostridia bacterium]|nr:nitroreductase [Clostridia bacterium]